MSINKHPYLILLVVLVFAMVVPITSSNVSGAASPPSCSSASMQLGIGPTLHPVTGEHAVIFTLTNRQASACNLHGFPRVNFLDSNAQVLAFRYSASYGSSSPYVTMAAPKDVVLVHGAVAYFLVAKYRCSRGTAQIASTIAVRLPGVSSTGGTFRSSSSVVRTFGYCVGKRGDPGQLVGVSPVTSTAAETYAGNPSAHGALSPCVYTRRPATVTPQMTTVVREYYAAKKLGPIVIDKSQAWILDLTAQRVGLRWCLLGDGQVSGYRGAVPMNATSAVEALVTHKPDLIGYSSHFVTLAKVNGSWKVVAEGTGP